MSPHVHRIVVSFASMLRGCTKRTLRAALPAQKSTRGAFGATASSNALLPLASSAQYAAAAFRVIADPHYDRPAQQLHRDVASRRRPERLTQKGTLPLIEVSAFPRRASLFLKHPYKLGRWLRRTLARSRSQKMLRASQSLVHADGRLPTTVARSKLLGLQSISPRSTADRCAGIRRWCQASIA
jgi:hypothetical protein